MIDFKDVMQRVKTILLQESKETKILDRDIASALDLDPQYFAVIKRRKKIPFVHLAYFCKAHKDQYELGTHGAKTTIFDLKKNYCYNQVSLNFLKEKSWEKEKKRLSSILLKQRNWG